MLYNDSRALPMYLASLERLNQLLVDRYIAGYVRSEPLDEFILKGHWLLDRNGDMGFAQLTHSKSSALVADVFPNIPAVLTIDAYKAFVESQSSGMRLGGTLVMGNAYSCVPPVGARCGACGEKFTLETAHRAHSFVTREDLMAVYWEKRPEFVGRTYPDLPRAIVEEGGKLIKLKAGTLEARLRNGRSLSEVHDYSYVFEEGDSMAYMRCRYAHASCMMEAS